MLKENYMRKMNKKGDLVENKLGNTLLIAGLLIVLVIIIYFIFKSILSAS